MKTCDRCYFKIGMTQTRCRRCGQKINRIRATFVSIISLFTGLGLGCWTIIALNV